MISHPHEVKMGVNEQWVFSSSTEFVIHDDLVPSSSAVSQGYDPVIGPLQVERELKRHISLRWW